MNNLADEGEIPVNRIDAGPTDEGAVGDVKNSNKSSSDNENAMKTIAGTSSDDLNKINQEGPVGTTISNGKGGNEFEKSEMENQDNTSGKQVSISGLTEFRYKDMGNKDESNDDRNVCKDSFNSDKKSTKDTGNSDTEVDKDISRSDIEIEKDARNRKVEKDAGKSNAVLSEDPVSRNYSSECVPDLTFNDHDEAAESGMAGVAHKVEWTIDDIESDLKVKDKLVLPTGDTLRRVSFGDENISIKEYELLADRRKSEGMQYYVKPHNSFRKHSSGDLHSRLKTRKLLGVGETDDGDVHRSKLSQILGHSDQLYIRLPSGLRLWQIVLSILFSIMSLWALVFPAHYFMSMYETDGQSYTFPIRLYATALVCIAVMYWSTIQASDREVIRLVLLSSIVFFALQTLVTGVTLLTSHELMTKHTVLLLVCNTVFALIGYYFQRGVTRGGTMRRTQSNKELCDKEQ